MSRPVMQKLAEGKTLDDDDVQWARDRGIALPEKYGEGPTSVESPMATTSSDFGAPPGSQRTGPVIRDHPGTMDLPSETEEDLEEMNKKQLRELAEGRGLEVPSGIRKDELIEMILEGDGEEDEDEDDVELEDEEE